MKYKISKGLTITELLVDLALSSIVITAIFGLYTKYKNLYETQTDLIYLYQNAKTAFNYLNDDVKVAGFYGCNSNATSLEYAMTPTFDYQLANRVSGYEASGTGPNTTITLTSPTSGWSPAFSGQVASANGTNGSDIFTLRFASTNPLGLLNTNTTGSTLSITGIQSKTKVGDILLISDCVRSVVFQVQTVSTNQITPTASVGGLNSGAEVYLVNVHSYYIKNVNGVTGLYRLNNGIEELLVPYAENMQLLYGQDTDGDGVTDKFNTANNITNNPIVSLYVSLLMRSIDKHAQAQNPNTYQMMAAPVGIQTTINVNTAADNYIRKTFDFYLTFLN